VHRRFTQEEVDRVWDMHQAGVPVKRIARTLGRQNVSLRVLISRSGGIRSRARVRNELPAQAAGPPVVKIKENKAGVVKFKPDSITVASRGNKACSEGRYSFILKNHTSQGQYLDNSEGPNISIGSHVTAIVCVRRASTYTIQGTSVTLTVALSG
jgi:hypothetical protein